MNLTPPAVCSLRLGLLLACVSCGRPVTDTPNLEGISTSAVPVAPTPIAQTLPVTGGQSAPPEANPAAPGPVAGSMTGAPVASAIPSSGGAGARSSSVEMAPAAGSGMSDSFAGSGGEVHSAGSSAMADAAGNTAMATGGSSGSADPPAGVVGSGSAAAEIFCDKYEEHCGFGKPQRHADRATCVADFDATPAQQFCKTMHLDTAIAGTAAACNGMPSAFCFSIHCLHATGLADPTGITYCK